MPTSGTASLIRRISAWSSPTSTSPAPAAAAATASVTVHTGASTAILVEYPHRSDITGRAWHESYVPVVFLISVIVVLAGVFFAATGRGGELAYERVDHAPLDLGRVPAPDVAMLRPPTAMWGYNMQVTDEALDRIARAMRDRDVTIAYLQQQLENRVSADPGPLPVRQTAGHRAAA